VPRDEWVARAVGLACTAAAHTPPAQGDSVKSGEYTDSAVTVVLKVFDCGSGEA
jgi:hypothetical protein